LTIRVFEPRPPWRDTPPRMSFSVKPVLPALNVLFAVAGNDVQKNGVRDLLHD
jgi:hypothetical protein